MSLSKVTAIDVTHYQYYFSGAVFQLILSDIPGCDPTRNIWLRFAHWL